MSCFEAFNNMCRKIVCPTRHQLNEDQMIQRKFRSAHVDYQSFDVINSVGESLSVIVFQKSFTAFPTILYLHGNGGHKLQSLQIAYEQINLIAFDFCGCGKSGGQFITYGEKQVQDIRLIVEQIGNRYRIKRLALWGRSMGASLALMYTAKYPKQIYSLILDTPFRFLKKVVLNVAQQSARSVPNFLLSIAVFFVQRKTQGLVGTSIFNNDFSKSLQSINVPILFAYSTKDTVVKQQDVKQLFDIYKGSKSISRIQCNLTSPRSSKVIHLDWIQIYFRISKKYVKKCSLPKRHEIFIQLMNESLENSRICRLYADKDNRVHLIINFSGYAYMSKHNIDSNFS